MSVMADMIGNRKALDGIYLEATLSSLPFVLPDINRCFLDFLLMQSLKLMLHILYNHFFSVLEYIMLLTADGFR